MLQGVPVIDIDPQLLRNVVSVDLYAKEMTRDLCPSVHDHVDVNGSFGIRKSILYCSLDRFDVDRDTPKGSTDIPRGNSDIDRDLKTPSDIPRGNSDIDRDLKTPSVGSMSGGKTTRV